MKSFYVQDKNLSFCFMGLLSKADEAMHLRRRLTIFLKSFIFYASIFVLVTISAPCMAGFVNTELLIRN